ncbi:hypothetical protein D3C87_2064170 [compost metagenome]
MIVAHEPDFDDVEFTQRPQSSSAISIGDHDLEQRPVAVASVQLAIVVAVEAREQRL